MKRSRQEPTELSALLLQLYRLSQEQPIDEFQDAALHLLRESLPFDSAMWGTATDTPQGIDIHHIHLQDQSSEMLAEYEALKRLDTAAQAVVQHRRHVMGFNAQDWFHRPHQAPLREHGKRHEQANFFIASDVDPATQFVHWFTLFRAREKARCTHQECGLLTMLAPHLMQALTLNRIAHLDRLEASGTGNRGSAVSDLRGVIYHADTTFRRLLQAEWPHWSGGQTDRLPVALLETFLQGRHRRTGRAAVVTRRVEDNLLFLHARPRCPVDDLTPRERAVAELAVRGSTYKEIAQVLERSPATVRNQIRSIYAKLGVSHVAGLVEAMRIAS